MSDFAKQVNTYQPSGNPTVPQVKKFSLTFTTEQQSISLMTGAQNTGNTLSPQTAIVDNTTNTYNVILTVNGVNYPVPAGACFTFPLVSFDDPDISVVSAGAGSCVITLSNQRMPGSMLGNSAAIGNVSITGALPEGTNVIGGVTLSGAVPEGSNVIGSVIIEPFNGPMSDFGGSIAVANTNYVIAPANANRRYFYFQNNSANTIFLNFGEAASVTPGVLQIGGGANLIMDNNYITTDSINILSQSANSWYSCRTA